MSRSNSTAVRAPLLALAALALAACGGGGGGSGGTTGTLKLGITDAPVDAAEAIHVQFAGVELKPMNGAAFSIDFAEAKTLDLVKLQGTTRAMLLDGEKVPAGDYEWMRLKVNAAPNVPYDSWVTIGGADCEIRIPSGSETGLKLIRGFTVGVGSVTDFTIDFDLRKSLVRPPGQHTMVEACSGQAYLMKPVLRIVDNLQVGSITGTIDPTLVSQKCGTDATVSKVAPGNVYLFGPYTDTAPVPDDVDGNTTDGADPIASAMVMSGASGNTYTIGFVPPGQYVVAYTCDPDQSDVDADAVDTPAGADEVVTFTPDTGTTATVTANTAKTVDFTVPVGP
jgi:hypothetical protein